jgi:hypothetical protein
LTLYLTLPKKASTFFIFFLTFDTIIVFHSF